jgi:maleylacetoacetate isomerase
MHNLVLYSYWRSSCSWRVRIALALKQLPFDYKAVNLLQNKHHEDTYDVVNPSRMVPVLSVSSESGVKSLSQSIAIMEYLEEAFQSPNIPSLFPSDPILRAKVREIVHIVACDIQPLQNLRVLRRFDTEDERKEWAKGWIVTGLEALEKILKNTSGKYCVGNQVSMADIVLVPQVYNAKRFGVDVERSFPTIFKIDETLAILPAFIAAHPSNQPDTPEAQ